MKWNTDRYKVILRLHFSSILPPLRTGSVLRRTLFRCFIFPSLWLFIWLLPVSVFACPECGCWDLFQLTKDRGYLQNFTGFPMKEKTVSAGEYQIFLSTIQTSKNINDLLLYAQHQETNKPYTKPKKISFLNELKSSPSVLETTDYNLISQIRYFNQSAAGGHKYLVKITLEAETGPVNAEFYLPLGSPPVNRTYLITLGTILSAVFITVIYLRRSYFKLLRAT